MIGLLHHVSYFIGLASRKSSDKTHRLQQSPWCFLSVENDIVAHTQLNVVGQCCWKSFVLCGCTVVWVPLKAFATLKI